MITEKVQNALNKQINAELYSSYLYLSMSSFFESGNLKGFANWMRIQAQEELVHAMKFYDHVMERGGKVILTSIEGPPTQWESAFSIFEHVFRHEQKVTGLINGLVDLAISEKDHATNNFLQWFVNEQVEEEASADEIVKELKLIGDSPDAMFFLDRELGRRVFTSPKASKGS